MKIVFAIGCGLIMLASLVTGYIKIYSERYQCVQHSFERVDTAGYYLFTDYKMYISEVNLKWRGAQLSLTTDSLSLVFVRITDDITVKSTLYTPAKTYFWAARAGYPNYIYYIVRVESDKGFIHSFAPVSFNKKSKGIDGAIYFAFNNHH